MYVAGQDYHSGDKNTLAKRGQTFANKNGENEGQIKYQPVWNQLIGKIVNVTNPSLT